MKRWIEVNRVMTPGWLFYVS